MPVAKMHRMCGILRAATGQKRKREQRKCTQINAKNQGVRDLDG